MLLMMGPPMPPLLEPLLPELEYASLGLYLPIIFLFIISIDLTQSFCIRAKHALLRDSCAYRIFGVLNKLSYSQVGFEDAKLLCQSAESVLREKLGEKYNKEKKGL